MTVIEWPADPAKLKPQQQLLLSTIRLEVIKSTGLHVGTGVFTQFQVTSEIGINAILTNRHVLASGQQFFGLFRRRTSESFIIDAGVRVQLAPPLATFVEHPSPDVDLAAIVLPPLANLKLPDDSRPGAITLPDSLFSAEAADKLQVGEELAMIGYPIGLYDNVHNLPVVRFGKLATLYSIDFNGKPEFLVDIGAFKGSSGSPILVLNVGAYGTDEGLSFGTRIMWLGMVWGGQVLRRGVASAPAPIPTAVDPLDSADHIPLNIAHCLKAREILVAKDHFISVLRGMNLLPSAAAPAQ